jgi:predicted transcriptional regulator of viral defense system
MACVLDSMKNPVFFADTGHVTRYMNKAAEDHYKEGRAPIGRSLLGWHNAASERIMVNILDEMEKDLDERKITDNERFHVYMRAARNGEGKLLG